MKVAYDIKLMRPACVNVAAGMGGSTEAAVRFHTEDWLEYPTPDMKLYETNEHQLLALLQKTDSKTADINAKIKEMTAERDKMHKILSDYRMDLWKLLTREQQLKYLSRQCHLMPSFCNYLVTLSQMTFSLTILYFYY